MVNTVRYTYRLRPGRTAQAALLAEWGQRLKDSLPGLEYTCGYTADRDLNAARTILATAERNRASADDIRHSITSFRDGGSDAVRAGNPPELSVGSR